MTLSLVTVLALAGAATWIDVPTESFPAAVAGSTLLLLGTMALEGRSRR